jgi:hypothetical protein
MPIFKLLVGIVLSLGALVASAAAQVNVRFTEPEKFTDLQSTWQTEASLLAALGEHLKQLGQKHLGEAQVLDIEVTDIDLAGSQEYFWRISPLRVMRDVTSPRISLRWRLSSSDPNGPAIEVTLRDMAYLSRTNHYAEGDPLRYEKLMLDDWFRRTFAAPK